MPQRVCGTQEAAALWLLGEVEGLVEEGLLEHPCQMLQTLKMMVFPPVAEGAFSTERPTDSQTEQTVIL